MGTFLESDGEGIKRDEETGAGHVTWRQYAPADDRGIVNSRELGDCSVDPGYRDGARTVCVIIDPRLDSCTSLRDICGVDTQLGCFPTGIQLYLYHEVKLVRYFCNSSRGRRGYQNKGLQDNWRHNYVTEVSAIANLLLQGGGPCVQTELGVDTHGIQSLSLSFVNSKGEEGRINGKFSCLLNFTSIDFSSLLLLSKEGRVIILVSTT